MRLVEISRIKARLEHTRRLRRVSNSDVAKHGYNDSGRIWKTSAFIDQSSLLRERDLQGSLADALEITVVQTQ